jgi:micrococcal nuclease
MVRKIVMISVLGSITSAILFGITLWHRSKQTNNLKQIKFEASQPLNLKESVKQVSDGDTLVLQSGERIRLCGIDAPELSQPLGQEAKANLENWVKGKVQVDRVEQDRYGRTVAEVWTDNGLVNAGMINVGMAYHYTQYSDRCPHRDSLISAEQTAQMWKYGVWKLPNAVKPWDYRRKK